MELKDYTEEQLRAELKRRYDERQKERDGFTQDTIGSGLILHIDNSENLYVLVNYRHNGECRNVEISNNMYNLSCPIQYVHELQHALRLCGLSELAENLKVL